MAAFFHSNGNNNIFKNSVGMGEIAVSDAFDNLNGGDSLAIITDVAVNVRETIQFFQSFDDFISFYYFGKGVGTISLSMMLFLECGGNGPGNTAPGLERLMSRLGGIRGTEIDFSVGNTSFSGVLSDFTIQIVSEPETHYLVQINLGMTNHTLEQISIPSGC